MSPGNENIILTAINDLTAKLGEVTGEFKGLKLYIETQTTECKLNYKELNKNFTKIRGRLNGIQIEDEVTDKVTDRLRRRLGDKRKFLYNTVTLLCMVILTAGTVMGIDYWRTTRNPSNQTNVYTQADARKDQSLMLAQIRNLAESIGQ